MRREWEPEDVVAHWTLVDDDGRLVANKTGPSRLGFALLLKFFELEPRFPRHADELPPAAVEYVAAQVKVEAVQLAKEDRRGLTPLFWTHVNPYGSFNLQMDRHLDLGLTVAAR